MWENVGLQIRIFRIVLIALIVAGIVPMFILFAIRGPVDGGGDDEGNQGYWGPKTANVNWCEKDYQHSDYVAETWNTISSFIMVFSGIYGIYMHAKTTETKFVWAFFCFTVIGCGSAAFHATLLRSMQLLDELPMLWINNFFVYIVLTMEDNPGRKRLTLAVCGVASTVLMTFAVVLFDQEDQNIFLLCYGGGVLFLIARSSRFPRLDANESDDERRRRRRGCVCGPAHAHRAMLETGVFFYGVAFFLWLIDRSFCSIVRPFHLHSFWHVGADLGTYSALLGWLFRRQQYLKRNPKLRGFTPLTRYCEVDVV